MKDQKINKNNSPIQQIRLLAEKKSLCMNNKVDLCRWENCELQSWGVNAGA